MIIHNISEQSSVLSTFTAELRDVTVQDDRMRFRRNIERIGEVLGYELSKTLKCESKEIETPLGTARLDLPEENLVICSILRAGIPLHSGLLNYFDKAENSFISAYRHYPEKDDNFEILVEYISSPSLKGKTLILADPMMATGRSFVNVYKALEGLGKPESIHLVSVIGAREGIEHVSDNFPENSRLWIATIDEDLNNQGYIVPGLGDAGDLAFGSKLQH